MFSGWKTPEVRSFRGAEKMTPPVLRLVTVTMPALTLKLTSRSNARMPSGTPSSSLPMRVTWYRSKRGFSTVRRLAITSSRRRDASCPPEPVQASPESSPPAAAATAVSVSSLMSALPARSAMA